MDAAHELARLRDLLRPVEAEAAHLPWADDRPWAVATHVGHDGTLAVVDLHGLPVRMAKRAIARVVAEPPDVGLVWVHGRGGARGKRDGVLGAVVLGSLRGHLATHPRWRLDPQGARTVWITDPDRAPTAGTSVALLAFGVIFGVAAAAALGSALGAW